MAGELHKGNVELGRNLAGKGHAGAQYFLGLVYYYGQGVPVNYPEAEFWLKKAAEQGHADSLEFLRRMEPSPQPSPEPAPEPSPEPAPVEVSVELHGGMAEPSPSPTIDKGGSFFLSQKFLTSVIVFLLLIVFGGAGWFYFGVVRYGNVNDRLEAGLEAYNSARYQEAYNLWLPLAQDGNAEAQSNIGALYLSGNGVRQDFVLAYGWTQLAERNGSRDTEVILDLARSRMDDEDLRAAREFADNCIRNKYADCR